MRRTITGMLLVAALALAGCGGAPASEAAEASVGAGGDDGDTPSLSASTAPASTGAGDGDGGEGGDLCTVLTTDEVADITGVDVTSTTPADLQGVLSCNYNGPDSMPVAGLTLATSAGGVSVLDMFEANEADGEAVSGIGDRAVLVGDEDFPILMVLVGDRLYSLSVIADSLDGAAKRAATEELARRSVDRLP